MIIIKAIGQAGHVIKIILYYIYIILLYRKKSDQMLVLHRTFNNSLENPRDDACSIENGLVLVSIIIY